MGFSVAVEGCLVGALAFLAYTLGRVWFDGPGPEPVVGRTMAFCVLSLSQLVHSFNMRSRRPVLRLGLFSNRKLTAACAFCAFLMVSVVLFPPLAALFQTAALTPFQWLLVAALSLCPLLVVEGRSSCGSGCPAKRKRRGAKASLLFPRSIPVHFLHQGNLPGVPRQIVGGSPGRRAGPAGRGG